MKKTYVWALSLGIAFAVLCSALTPVFAIKFIESPQRILEKPPVNNTPSNPPQIGQQSQYVGTPPPLVNSTGGALGGHLIIFSMVEATNADEEAITLVTLDNGIQLEVPAGVQITQTRIENWYAYIVNQTSQQGAANSIQFTDNGDVILVHI